MQKLHSYSNIHLYCNLYHSRSVLAKYGVFNRNTEPSGNFCRNVPLHMHSHIGFSPGI